MDGLFLLRLVSGLVFYGSAIIYLPFFHRELCEYTAFADFKRLVDDPKSSCAEVKEEHFFLLRCYPALTGKVSDYMLERRPDLLDQYSEACCLPALSK